MELEAGGKADDARQSMARYSRLIAAAPDMLAALKQIAAGGLGVFGAIAVAEEAVAKAEGRI
jgi:hypothetical protein